MAEKYANTILVDYETFLYILDRDRKEQGKKPASYNQITMKKNGIGFRDGKGYITDLNFSTPVAIIKQWLEEAGLQYQDGPEVEYMDM